MKIVTHESNTNTLGWTNNWKFPFEVQIAPYTTLKFDNTIMGCNIMQMTGIYMLCHLEKEKCSKLIEFFNTTVKDNLRSHGGIGSFGNYGVGVVLCIINTDYYEHASCKRFLDETGFVKVAEAPRLAHAGDGNQFVFVLTLSNVQ